MAILVSFHPSGMTKAKYDKAIEALDAAGVWPSERATAANERAIDPSRPSGSSRGRAAVYGPRPA
jgi:hypothetical protein